MPRFPTNIGDRTFDVADQYMKGIVYHGPVALSCDDTKLHPSYRTYWDPEKNVYMLIGGLSEPHAVANADELRNVLKSLPDTNKATKIRLWALLIPCPGIPPLILAAKAIPNTLDAGDLYRYLSGILNGLSDRGIHVASYSCDGTEAERSVQRSVISKAESRFVYTIKHPMPGFDDFTLKMARINGRLITMIQDSKHAAKTYRNNLFSGARVLVLGNHVALYQHIRDLALDADGPLYMRDVEKVDRQDDNAASRLFSSASLDHSSSQYPHRKGILVYLFVFGELIDAYQNRHISHRERIKMALRAWFFLQSWRHFLAAAGYPESRYFISREAADISRILIEGRGGLILIYRDHTDGVRYPLLPWLHSTEVCEHLFGECRKLIKDFTYLDFIFMVPRLSILERTAMKFMQTTDSKARASGYAHTYFDHDNVDIALLSVFPSDEEVQVAAQKAWQEVENLMELLGIMTADLPAATSDASRLTQVPLTPSWYPTVSELGIPVSMNIREDSEVVSDEESIDEEDLDESEDSETVQVEHIIAAEETAHLRKSDVDDAMFSLTCAAVALSLDETNMV